MVFKKIRPRFLRYTLLVFLGLVLACFVFVLSIYWGAWGKLPNSDTISEFQYQRASEIYTADSVLIGKYFLYDRQPISYNELPEHLVHALVAIEDERFYEHSGVDYKSLLRVAFKTVLLQDQSAGGGSTISQQLAKNLFPRQQGGKLQLVVTKIKEMFIARRLENLYSKEEVLLHYLNTVSFGDNTFGIESASQKFFDKRAKDLNIEEGAALIGMLKATYAYNPRIFPEKSKNRRNLVLQAMAKNDFLNISDADSLSNISLKLNYRPYDHNSGLAPYFREEVRKLLIKWRDMEAEKGNEYNIYTSGLKIYTTLDFRMQSLAEEAMAIHMKSLQRQFEKSYGNYAPWIANKKLVNKTVKNSQAYKKLVRSGLSETKTLDSLGVKKNMTLGSWEGEQLTEASTIDSLTHYMKFLNTGSLSINPKTGAVKTWIGGVNFKYFKYDHISQSKRQVGSTFKPILYTAALESGVAPCTYFSAQEVEYKNLEGWSPGNSGDEDETFLNYSMKQALSRSVNTVAVKVLEKTGIPRTLEQAKKMGITANLPKQASLALGTGEISLDELIGAYASFVNQGRPVKPYLIEHITDSKGEVVYIHNAAEEAESAISDENRKIMLEMMKATIDEGTASRIRSRYGLRNDIAGKTGTTQNNKDAWFVGVTPKLVHASWVGLDNHEIGFSSTALGQGANAALPLFAILMQKLNQDPNYDYITRARFDIPGQEVLNQLDCEPIKRDGFLKRLFKNPKKKRKKKFKNKKE